MNPSLKLKLGLVALAAILSVLAAFHGVNLSHTLHVLGEPEVAGGAGAGAQ